ncbi:MAG: glutamate racemase [Bacillota bacterium]
MDKYKAVAVLDSGVGGLTVAKEIIRQLPFEHIVYFGDTAHMPYGPRPAGQVRSFVYRIMDFLLTQQIKIIIVACNAATAAGLEYYRERVTLPLLGVIEPGVRAALGQTRNRKVGVIGTSGTIESGAYQRVFQRLAPDVALFSRACPLFVLVVENELVHNPEVYRVAEEYLQPLKKAGVDTLILGCTHYPLLAEVIGAVMGPEVKLISSAEETAQEARRILEEKELLQPREISPVHRFYVSGPARNFSQMAVKLLEKEVRAFQVVLDEETPLLV